MPGCDAPEQCMKRHSLAGWLPLISVVLLLGSSADLPFGWSARVDPDLNPVLAQTVAAPVSAAKWLVQTSFIASSLETGRVGYVEAWGGDEYGRAYTYALSGQPGGVTIDGETGMLSLGVRLEPGTYRFSVVATNRQAITSEAAFPVVLDVKPGVTANRETGQILSKSYYVDSGQFGKPTGTDFTKVLGRIHDTIIEDQRLAGDGNLRATVYFRRGGLYDYTVNSWPAGIQYLTVAPDPAYDSKGPRPRLRNVRSNFVYDSELAILGTGDGSAFERVPGDLKSFSPRIVGAEPGQDFVELKDSADAGKITVGRWHLIGSYDQQVGGFPPNIRYFDFVKVTAVDGTRVILDRKLRHRHRDDFFEDPIEPSSLGVARIVPLDMGGPGGLLPANPQRFSIRQTFRDIEFLKNPSTSNGSNTVLYISDALDASFENCVMPRPVPTIVENMRFLGGSMESAEPDKIISTLIFDGVKAGEIGGATGVEFVLVRDSTIDPIQVSPRQLRVLRTSIDGTHNTHLWYPVTFAYNGQVLDAEFESTSLTINPTNSDHRVMPAIQRGEARIGTDVHWQDDVMVVPRSSAVFLDWQVWLFEGAVVRDAAHRGSWGIVRRLSSPGDGTAIWAHFQWMAGTRPTSGTVSFSRGYRVTVDSESKLVGQGEWEHEGSGFVEEDLPTSFNVTHPAGEPTFPLLNSGFQ
jgi:hypothetical protein